MTEHSVRVRAFDHLRVAGRDEYRAAAVALDRLAAAISEVHTDVSQDEWMRLVSDLAWSLQLCDAGKEPCCASVEFFPPARIEVEPGWVTCTYICKHGRQWTCGWALAYRAAL